MLLAYQQRLDPLADLSWLPWTKVWSTLFAALLSAAVLFHQVQLGDWEVLSMHAVVSLAAIFCLLRPSDPRRAGMSASSSASEQNAAPIRAARPLRPTSPTVAKTNGSSILSITWNGTPDGRRREKGERERESDSQRRDLQDQESRARRTDIDARP